MAYDANDPADKKILADAVAAALAEQQEEHETSIQGLKDKNADLLKKLAKARTATGEGSADEVTRLEGELDDTKTKLRTAEADLRKVNRDLKDVTTERDTTRTALDTEQNYSRSTLIDNDLTSALLGANVDPELMDGVKALLGKDVTVKVDGDKRTTFVGDKSLGDYVKEWSQGDKGKRYVLAANNGGGGAGAGNRPSNDGGTTKIADLKGKARIDYFNKIGETAFNEQLARERAAG